VENGAPSGVLKKSNLASREQRLELADIFRQHGQSFLQTHRIPWRHRKVMQQIMNCRTAILGGHRQWCARCGFQRYLYHSCRNRHCPKCQTAAKEAWRAARQLELLPVPYFHNVFTLPHELNALILRSESNQKAMLKLLFDATAQTLLEFGRREFGGKVGFTLVLHTWDQQLRPHFHLHCLIASGALAEDGSRWVAGGRRFLFAVRGLSKMFRAKFLTGLRQLFREVGLDLTDALQPPAKQRQLVKGLFKKSWVVYSKPPFAGPAKLLDYLSRYTHRVAINNSRLLRCRDGNVTFSYRDRRDGDRRKQLTLSADKFIGRFLTHVLPGRFMRIRHYGFLANRHKQTQLARIRKLIGAQPTTTNALTKTPKQWLLEAVGIEPNACPCCGERLLKTELPSQLTGSPLTNEFARINLTRGPPT
jgi:hypothetical protein